MELESLAMEVGYSLSSQEPVESGLSPTKDDGEHGCNLIMGPLESFLASACFIMHFPLDSPFGSESFIQLAVNFVLSFSDTWGW